MIFNRAAIIATLLAVAVSAQNTKVNISIQPAFHGIPIFAAFEFGWFKELGLDVELSMYSSGGPQVKDAVDNQAWDFGIAGSVPNVLAGSQGIRTIGINNDESATTKVFGAPGVTQWPPATLYGGIFAATADSTGELLLRKCLDAAGVEFTDAHITENPQSQILNDLDRPGFAEGQPVDGQLPAYGSLWAPNTYTYEESHPRDIEVMCSGRDVDFRILGGLMVREEYAKQNSEIVAKILAAYLRGVSFLQNRALEDQVLEISEAFHQFAGIPVSQTALKEDLILRPLFNLDQQLDAMNRNFANNYESELDKHYLELEDFLFAHNVIGTKYLPKEYVTDEYMKMVSDNEELRAYSYLGAGTDSKAINNGSSSIYGDDDDKMEAALIVGIVLCTIGIISLIVAIVTCLSSNNTPTVNPITEDAADKGAVEGNFVENGGASSASWRREAV